MKPGHNFLTTCILLPYALFSFAQGVPVSIQAESGTLGADFRIVDTLGIRSITVNTNENSLNPASIRRVATYQVTFPDSGTYDLYAHILVGPNSYNDDSYFYANSFGIRNAASDLDWKRANGLASVGYSGTFDLVGGAGTAFIGVWKWINISKYSGDGVPLSFRVEPGILTRTFQIGGRETGLYIDKLVFGKKGLHFTVSNLNKGEAGTDELPGEPLLDTPMAAGKDKFLGCAWDYEQSPYFAGYFNQLTPGNAGKWGSVEATRNVMNWTVLDSAYRLARKYHILLKEHTLIWGAQQPSWIGALDTATQRQEIEAWFAALAERYDTIEYIDVVNEPIHNAPNGMIPWGTTIPNVDYADALGGAGTTGWDWIINSFRMARHYFPASKLILNEYNVINSSTTTQQYIGIINLLKAGNLIDGIGEQAHAFTTNGVSTATLKANMDALAATGIPLYLTELDMDGPTDLAQLQEIQRIFPLFWEHPAVKGITLWGFRYPVWRQAQGANLITADEVERPAMRWLKAYVNDTLTLMQSIMVSAAGNVDTIFVGDKLLMGSQVLPANTTIQNVSWSVTPAGLATISSTGLLSAVATGTITVKATAWDGSGVIGTIHVYITNRLVESITVSAASNKDSIHTGESLQMNAQVLPTNATNRTYTWGLQPDGLAQITSNGLLTSLAQGRVTIKATANDGSGVSDTFSIVILNQLVQSITITASNNADTLYMGESLQMSASVLPVNATNPLYSWSVSPDSLANISEDGLLTAMAKGTVTVRAAANDESGVSDSLVINIVEEAPNAISIFDAVEICVFPNPAVSCITIMGPEHSEIEISNLQGQLKYKITYHQSSPTICITGLPAGVYIIKVKTAQGIAVKKFIRE